MGGGGGADGWWKRQGGGAVRGVGGCRSVTKGNHKEPGWDNEERWWDVHRKKQTKKEKQLQIPNPVAKMCLLEKFEAI